MISHQIWKSAWGELAVLSLCVVVRDIHTNILIFSFWTYDSIMHPLKFELGT